MSEFHHRDLARVVQRLVRCAGVTSAIAVTTAVVAARSVAVVLAAGAISPGIRKRGALHEDDGDTRLMQEKKFDTLVQSKVGGATA